MNCLDFGELSRVATIIPSLAGQIQTNSASRLRISHPYFRYLTFASLREIFLRFLFAFFAPFCGY
jgi:hypothetical protein